MEREKGERLVCSNKTLYVCGIGLLCIIALFSFTSIDTFHASYSWHDQQRISQLGLLFYASLSIIVIGFCRIYSLLFWAVISVFAIGLISSLKADFTLWALKEWARYIGLFFLCLMVGACAQLPQIRRGCFLLIALVGMFHSYQFVVYYISAFVSGIQLFEADLLFNGFSNPRFFGQFQVVVIPLLAHMSLSMRKESPFLSFVFFTALVIGFCIAFCLGGRGLWLSLFVSCALLISVVKFSKVVKLQVFAAALGFAAFVVLFFIVPHFMGVEPSLRDGLRATLSGREELWLRAWEMVLKNPWLGVGPMHYAATYNTIAAHPHQVILQWAAEWGVIATLLGLALGVAGVLVMIFRLRHEQDNEGDGVFLAITGALVLAQVDGVFVMPYVETWLAVIIGLGIAKWKLDCFPAPNWQRACLSLMAGVVILVLGQVLVNEVPALPHNSELYMEKNGTGWVPRFWLQGWIPMDN